MRWLRKSLSAFDYDLVLHCENIFRKPIFSEEFRIQNYKELSALCPTCTMLGLFPFTQPCVNGIKNKWHAKNNKIFFTSFTWWKLFNRHLEQSEGLNSVLATTKPTLASLYVR